MLLSLTTTHFPATDLGFLLHKHPSRAQSFTLAFGTAHVFYPEAKEDRCTAALLLDLDPIKLVRGSKSATRAHGPLAQYVNDRPYTASSFLSVAMARVFKSALAGRCGEKPELANTAIPLRAEIPVLPCRDETLLHSLFEPLTLKVTSKAVPLDTSFPQWGPSRYYSLSLEGTCRLSELLTYLYVLIPVLDDAKHYYVGEEEIEKLLRYGAGWLYSHPLHEQITKSYLRHQRSLTREALARLADEDDPDPETTVFSQDQEECALEERLAARQQENKTPTLNQQRIDAVFSILKNLGAKRILDLGCGEGRLLRALLDDRAFLEIVGMDVSQRALENVAKRLSLDRLPPMQKERIRLLTGSLMYRDDRLCGYDAAVCMEVIEHLDPARLVAFEKNVFGVAKPGAIVITTPNAEYNANYVTLAGGGHRHKDHRFEWSRNQFQNWATQIAEKTGYSVKFESIGPVDGVLGPPTQMAVFIRS